MKTLFKTIVPPLLILMFVYAAFSKLLTVHTFKGQLYNQNFPHWMAGILLYTLIPAELLTAGLLCFSRTQRLGLFSSTALLFAFTVYIALVLLHFWNRIPCSCGGILSGMGWGTHLVFNIFFLGISLSTLFVRTEIK